MLIEFVDIEREEGWRREAGRSVESDTDRGGEEQISQQS